MTFHEQFAEDLALYALGSLSGDEERLALEKHLETCNACRRELEQLRGDMGLLSLSTLGATPPARSRTRLMDAIASEPRRMEAPQSVSQSRSWWAFAPWAVAAALAIVAGILWSADATLKRQMASLQSGMSQQQQELVQARDVVATLTAPEAQQVTLVAAKTPPLPHGKAFYLRSTGRLIFLASNLPPLPPEKIYELWLIPTSGSPVAAGLFRPDAHGGAAVLNPPLSPGLEAKTFAVTLEPATGSHEAPRGQAVIVGAGE
jgi:anti-sigma-K factor RskA